MQKCYKTAKAILKWIKNTKIPKVFKTLDVLKKLEILNAIKINNKDTGKFQKCWKL